VGGHIGALGRFMVVAINSLGFASLSTNGGGDWTTHLVPSGGDFSAAHFSSSPAPSGWYTTAPTVTTDQGWTLYCDGGPVPSPYTFADGEHTCSLQRPDGTFVTTTDGSRAYLTVLVDTVVPTVSVAVADTGLPYPTDGNRTHPMLNKAYDVTYTVTCGPSACVTTDNLNNGKIDTRTPGLSSVSITAVSAAGLTGSFTKPIRVVYHPSSNGFLSPVVAAPGLNLTVRTLVYGFAFHLVDGNQANVTTGAGPGSTKAFTDTACPQTNNTVQLPKLNSETATPFHTGNGNWLWDIAMPNPGLNVAVCRHLTVTANDGWTHFDADIQIAP
jgi:hypothetical protein